MLWRKVSGAGGVSAGVTASLLGSFVTSSSADVTGIDLTDGEVGDFLVVMYGVEGTTRDASLSPSDFTLGGEPAVSGTPMIGHSGGSHSAILVFPYGGGASGSNVTLSANISIGTVTRSAVSIVRVRGAGAVAVADTYAAAGQNVFSKTVTPSANTLVVATALTEDNEGNIFWDYSYNFKHNIVSPFLTDGTGLYSSWEFFRSGRSSFTAAIDTTSFGRAAATVAALEFTPLGDAVATIFPALDGVFEWDGVSALNFGSHGEYTLTMLADVTVTTKMWGAGGATGYAYDETITSNNNRGAGGGGGYSSAQIVLRSGSSYVVQIGQGGIRTTTVSSGATHEAGGVNTTFGGTQGGGYSGIFKNSVSQANALLMAGGGGGGSDSDFSYFGGAGGGSSGQNANERTSGNQGGEGGTQSAGGAPSVFNNATAGSALIGGLAQDNQGSLGGGGGGYFGGGGGNVGGGGGGSGRIGADSDVSSGVTTTGSGATAANSSDPDRNGAGNGGNAVTYSGSNGRVILTPV